MSDIHYFSGAIWTNHALERINKRGLTKEMAGLTFHSPDRVNEGKEPYTKEFHKRFGKTLITIIGKKNEKNEWVILSIWANPPLEGTEDFKKRQRYITYKNSKGWKKFLLTFLRQFGW